MHGHENTITAAEAVQTANIKNVLILWLCFALLKGQCIGIEAV